MQNRGHNAILFLMQSIRNRHTQAGDTLLTSLLFLFVLAGTLRLCFNQTLHESKLSSIFVQETQAYYIMENMMAMTRDYIYQLTQNPRYPCIFFGVDAFKRKGTGKLFTLNTDVFAKTQIVPDGFPLKIKDSGWDLKVGPIFWQDKTYRHPNKWSIDIRYFSETFMLGALQIDSSLVPDWTMYMAQTFEIERNPLCDFGLYAEGDLAVTGNFGGGALTFYPGRPAQINGNTRFLRYTQNSANTITFPTKLAVAGHALQVSNSTSASIQLPTKYGMKDNYNLYHYKLKLPNASGVITYKVGSTTLSSFNNSNAATYETTLFNSFKNNFIPRARVYRPSGFDPIGDAAFWMPEESGVSASFEKIWDYTVGFRMLTREKDIGMLSANLNRVTSAGSSLRGLNVKQINERLCIVRSQQIMCFPGIEIRALLKTKDEVNRASLDVANNFPYVTYASNAFPAVNDNLYLSRYFTLRTQSETVFFDDEVRLQENNTSTYDYAMDSTGYTSLNVPGDWIYQSIVNNKLVVSKTKTSKLFAANAAPFLKYKSKYPVTSYTDTRYPPHKLIDCGDHWEEDTSARTRIVDDARYNFLYDRNRGKWIQVLDFDIGAFMTYCKANPSIWERAQRTLKFNGWWAGHRQNANRNYIIDGTDIRNNYPARHNTFISNANNLNGGYSYVRGTNPPVIDVGIRLVNASSLGGIHNYGMTIVCPFPLYIQGDFNVSTVNDSVLIVADSITVLSSDFGDWSSSMNPCSSYLRNTNPTPPTICANIITGRTHPNYWPVNNTAIYPDFGVHDAFRTLEPFASPIKFHGTLMLPYYSMEQWEPPIDFNPKGYPRTQVISGKPYEGYGPADLANISDTLANGTNHFYAKSTECMPTYLKINRGRKTMMLGKTTYDALVALYNKDSTATSYTFKTYHNTDLPNYLKMDKDM